MDSTTIPGAGNSEDPDVRTVLRQTDWSTSPLGLPETWPRELVAVAHLVFDSEFPMFVAWGAELGFLYNDAYAAVMGRKHPAGFGQRFRDVWPEIWEDIRSIVQDALDGKSAWFEDLPLIVERKGYREEAWFTFSYSPVKDANGSVAGIYCACVETTNRVLVEKRQVFQLGLSDQLRDLGSSDEVIARSSDMLGRLLQASRVLYAEVDDERATLHACRDWTPDASKIIACSDGWLDAIGPQLIACLRLGEVVAVDDIEQDARSRGFAEAYASLGARAQLLIPLRKAGRPMVVLVVHKALPHRWSREDIALAQDTGERTWASAESVRAQTELRIERDRNQHILDNMIEGFALIDADWTMAQVNAEGLRLMERTAADVIGRNHWTLLPGLLGTPVETMYREVVRTGEPGMVEHFTTFPGGREAWIELRAHAVPDGGLAVFFRDITRRRHAEEALRGQTEKLRLATEAAELGLFDHNVLTAQIHWNDRLYQQFGIDPGTVITRAIFLQRLHPEDRGRMQRMIESLWMRKTEGRYRAEYRIVTPAGEERWIFARGQVFFDAEGKPIRIVGATLDITQRKEAEKRIQEASQHDSLTGLPNRALLYEYCGHILAMSARYGEPGALLFIDLDRFKPVNDMYGHDVGDKVLQEVGRRLLTCSRKEDIVSRLGGDEFIVVLPRIASPEDALAAARNMLHAIAEPIRLGGLEVSVSPSIGISLFPEHAADLESLIRCADMAMYAAKRSGRNTVQLYNPGLNEYARGLLRLEILLKHALERDRLALYYQPILDVQTRALIGAEALVRIPSEDGAMLSPTAFIPVAETAGLMNRLGGWVVHEACRQHRAWRDAGLQPITIAVNVSPSQFRNQGFVGQLAAAIRQFDIDPACLQIEVTESTVMENIPQTVATLNRLQQMGIKIALDDFGTGYSSLSHLSNLPLNKLKIDQSFIRQMDGNAGSRSITEAIIGLGQTLNLKVVGEGIDSESAMDFLVLHGCDQAQGFLFSEPLPADQFAEWCRRHGAVSADMPDASATS